MAERTRPRLARALVALLVAGCPLSAGCALSHDPDGSDDSGAHDAALEAGFLEAGFLDAGFPDGGLPPFPDAGRDAGPLDLGSCDDLDPCTVDALVGGVCTPAPAPDGSLCDDGDSCTLGDRCASGRCVGGAPSTGSAAVLSVAVPALRGVSVGIGGDRFLFFQPVDRGTDVVLARGTGDRLDTVDTLRLVATEIRAGFWLGAGLVAYEANHRGGLIEVAGDELIARGDFDLGGVLYPHHFAALEGRLLVCPRDFFGNPADLRVYDASSATLVPLGPRAIPGGCRALAVSTDRQHVYVSVGTDTLVMTPDGAVERALGIASESVHVGGGHLTLTTRDRALLVRESDLAEVARVDGRVWAARHTTRGLEVLTDEDRAGGTDRVLSIYDVAPLALVSAEILARDIVVVPGAASRWASHDDALLEGQRLFRLGTSAPFLDEIRDPRRFWPFWMRAAGTTLHLRDDGGAIAIDLSDPAAPRAIAGGELHGAAGISIEIPGDGEIGLYGARDWWPTFGLHRPRALFTAPLARVAVVARTFDAEERPTEHAVHTLPGAPSDLSATFRHLYAVEPDPSGASVRVRRWSAEQLADPAALVAQLDRTLRAPAGDTIAVVARVHDDAAIAFATTADAGSATIHWASLDDGASTAGPLRLDFEVHDLAVRGDRVIVMGWHPDPSGGAFLNDIVLATLERRGDALVEVSREGWAVPPTPRTSALAPIQLLRFDGRIVYAQLPFGTPAEPFAAMVALRAADLSQSEVYPLGGNPPPIWSMSESDVGLVLSGPGGVRIARPWCP